jgi:RimJ/RimL family protein N-acetyltransferase
MSALSSVTIRPIDPGDQEGLATFFSRLSDESRRRRFLGPKPKLSARELRFLTEVDQCKHVALVAVTADGAIVGVGRYATWHDSPDRAEMAFAVVDEWQGRGLGTRLGNQLVARARTSGIAALTGSTFATNTPAKALLKKLGFLPTGISAGIAEYELAFGAT